MKIKLRFVVEGISRVVKGCTEIQSFEFEGGGGPPIGLFSKAKVISFHEAYSVCSRNCFENAKRPIRCE